MNILRALLRALTPRRYGYRFRDERGGGSSAVSTYVDQLHTRRAQEFATIEGIAARAVENGRELSEAELASIEEIRTRIAPLDTRIAELSGDLEATDTANGLRRRSRTGEVDDDEVDDEGETLGGGRSRGLPAEPRRRADRYRQGGEELVYHDRRPAWDSFLMDALRADLNLDAGATERIRRHTAQMNERYRGTRIDPSMRTRDVATANFAGLVVPQYLTEMAAPLARAMRPFADICRQHPLPPSGMTVNISRITTGTATAIQAAENDVAQETNIDDTLLTIDVRTIAGMQDVSRQAVMRGTGVDDTVVEDLHRAHDTNLDDQLISGSGAAGQILGLRNVVGINAVTYTDATPTVGELYPKAVNAAIAAPQGAVFAGGTDFVMAPRRWAWVMAALDTAGRPLATPMPYGPNNTLGTGPGRPGYGPTGWSFATIPVTTDGNIPLTVGAGTEDVILSVNRDECHLWEDPSMPMQVRFEHPEGRVAIRIVLFSFTAFTAGRYPAAHSVISGTGLIAPTF